MGEEAVARESELAPPPKSGSTKKQIVFVLAGIMAILIGVGVAIFVLRSDGNESEAATLRPSRVNRAEPLETAGLNDSLEIPFARNQPDAGTAPEEPAEEPEEDPEEAPAANGNGGSRGANTKGGRPPSSSKGPSLTEEERAELAKAAAMGLDHASPLPGKRGNKGTSESVDRGQPLSGEDIRSTVAKNRASIQRCYEREMRGSGGSDLRVVVRMTVRPSGVVSSAAVTPSSLRGTGLGQCIEAAVRRWRFPTATAQSVVEAPFLLTPGQGR